MKNITIETNWVRVIGNTRNPEIKEINEMVGLESDVFTSDYYDDTICVWNKDKTRAHCFNKTDVRFLTAGMHNEEYIAIGDEVLAVGEWRKVFGFYMYDNEAMLQTGTLEATQNFPESSIRDHRTEPSLSGTQVTVTIDGKDYPATVN